ncbi:hypothetical protein [Desulfonema ishimotonii]|uniref:hypothetical protein n=1 Tax=Desulfonema ishimotonii TaxID=45657 RepID=UPI00140B67E6|nr:hypothetical protein [Desulfonema ishimotonii]
MRRSAPLTTCLPGLNRRSPDAGVSAEKPGDPAGGEEEVHQGDGDKDGREGAGQLPGDAGAVSERLGRAVRRQRRAEGVEQQHAQGEKERGAV